MNASETQTLRRPWYRPSLTVQIMIGLIVGGLIGLRPDWGNKVYFLRDIFINLTGDPAPAGPWLQVLRIYPPENYFTNQRKSY